MGYESGKLLEPGGTVRVKFTVRKHVTGTKLFKEDGMKERAMNAFGSLGYHKGYIHDQLQYSVLAIDRIDPVEKEKIRAAVKVLTTDREAVALIGNGWTYEILDRHGRVGILKKNGIEVALFFKRQVVQEQPGPGDPVPERALEDLNDLWQRLDVIGPSAKQANRFIKREVEQLREKVGLLEKRCENLVTLAADAESATSRKQRSIEALNDKIEKLYAKFMPDDRIIAKQAGYKYLTPAQAKAERAKLAKKKGRKP